MNSHTIETTVRMQVTFTLNDVVADPTTITFDMLEPDGTVIAHTFGVDSQLVKVSTGIYKEEIVIDQEGVYEYRFKGSGASGTVNEASEGRFEVPRSSFVT